MKKEPEERLFSQEKGAVLVFSLMAMIVLSILSMEAFMSTNTDMQISINYRTMQTAFYNTEGVMDVLPGVIRRSLAIQTESPAILVSLGITDSNGTDDGDGISDTDEPFFTNIANDDESPAGSGTSDFVEFIMGYPDPGGIAYPPDLTTSVQNTNVTVVTQRNDPENLAGFSTGFATGYEGGSLTGKTIPFPITGTGTETTRNSESVIAIEYRCVERSGGGCL